MYKQLYRGGSGYIHEGSIWLDADGRAFVRSELMVAKEPIDKARPIQIKRSLNGKISIYLPAGTPKWCWALGGTQRKPTGPEPRPEVGFNPFGGKPARLVAVGELRIDGILQPSIGGAALMPLAFTQSASFQPTQSLEHEWRRFDFPDGMRQFQLSPHETQRFLESFIRQADLQTDPIAHKARIELARHIGSQLEFIGLMAADAVRYGHDYEAQSYYLLRGKEVAAAMLDAVRPALQAADADVRQEAQRIEKSGQSVMRHPVPHPNTKWLPLIEQAKQAAGRDLS